MTKWLLAAVVVTGGVHAQGIVGTWQATLPQGENPRIALRITKQADGSLRGSLQRVDLPGFNVPLTRVLFAGGNLSVSSEFAGFRYEGRESEDGKTLAGNWTETAGPPPGHVETYPLTFSLATAETLWKSGEPMAASADPAYEVASIRESNPENTNWNMVTWNRKFEAHNMPMKELIKFAYEIRGRQVEGGPAWLNELRLDIQAEPDTPGLPTVAQHRAMCRKLLKERFGLTFHWTEKVFPTWELTVAKSAPGMQKSDAEEPGYRVFAGRDADGFITMRFDHTTMVNLAAEMMNFVQDRHVVDATGLKGEYDFTLRLPPGMFGPPAPGETQVDPATAYAKALEAVGLKMEARKGPLPVMEIDHLDKPSAN